MQLNGVFPKCFTGFAEFSDKKTFVITVKGLEPATQSPLVWETRKLPQHQQDTCRDRISKLSPIHASVILRFPEFAEFIENSAIFRKNSNVAASFEPM